jgi:hypothetical protein
MEEVLCNVHETSRAFGFGSDLYCRVRASELVLTRRVKPTLAR